MFDRFSKKKLYRISSQKIYSFFDAIACYCTDAIVKCSWSYVKIFFYHRNFSELISLCFCVHIFKHFFSKVWDLLSHSAFNFKNCSSSIRSIIHSGETLGCISNWKSNKYWSHFSVVPPPLIPNKSRLWLNRFLCYPKD